MADDGRRNQNNNRNQNRHHNRNNQRRNRGGGNRGGGGRRDRKQRPLLTSATNACGLTLIALISMVATNKGLEILEIYLGVAVLAFGIAVLASYIAQRVKPNWVEKISDLFFIIGLILIVYVGTDYGGFWKVLGL